MTKPIPAPRPASGVRRSATPSGVTHVRAYQSSHYTIIGNHLAQHRALSLTAIGLATHILSLPQGAPVDIRSLADRFPEGRDRIAFGLRELEAHGYLERVRERMETGRFVTRTYAHNAPGLTHGRAETPEVRDRPVDPAARVAPITPAVPMAPTVAIAVVEPVRAVEAEVDDDPATEEPAPLLSEPSQLEPSEQGPSEQGPSEQGPSEQGPSEQGPSEQGPSEQEPPNSEHHDEAVALLAGLRRTDDRFALSRKDVKRLAPAVVAWFDNGASRAAVIHAMTADVPVLLRSPAGFLAHRLWEGLPPPMPPLSSSGELNEAPPPNPVRTTPPDPWTDPWTDCEGGCTRVFRLSAPEKCCRDCRARRAAASEPVPTV
ncbi:helix-turn-helix domain-containing protein [Streptomyces sp. NPDC005476]|uniref:helix-turn-helix domain-containing protein n=1 Tax=Streptomyces sp. NPDC005476 TaxID=3156882 RepID=UPI00345200E8